ncbi:hypothetical protein [Tenacibaculum amylolyticum]|uniref:hypothetical protein n=1 Tax=Tenacibaculum amylolyticum TaxID=104269 RepID=UPI003894956F
MLLKALHIQHIKKGIFISFFLISALISAQEEKEALQKLSFMIGNWQGTSTSFSNNTQKSVSVSENVRYILNGNLITLDVKSPWIELHTIISFNKKEQSYYYHPFSKTGVKAGYKGTYKDGVFRVYFNPGRRLTFTQTTKGEFHEYGEQLKNGVWEKYFEDILQSSK